MKLKLSEYERAIPTGAGLRALTIVSDAKKRLDKGNEVEICFAGTEMIDENFLMLLGSSMVAFDLFKYKDLFSIKCPDDTKQLLRVIVRDIINKNKNA
jgi:hypothetical protein